jgi:XFP C-terminal domain
MTDKKRHTTPIYLKKIARWVKLESGFLLDFSLQPENPILGRMMQHMHAGLSDTDFDSLFTKDKPIVFAFHGYP